MTSNVCACWETLLKCSRGQQSWAGVNLAIGSLSICIRLAQRHDEAQSTAMLIHNLAHLHWLWCLYLFLIESSWSTSSPWQQLLATYPVWQWKLHMSDLRQQGKISSNLICAQNEEEIDGHTEWLKIFQTIWGRNFYWVATAITKQYSG